MSPVGLLTADLQKRKCANFFHTMKALTSCHVSTTLIVIENRNNANWTLHDTPASPMCTVCHSINTQVVYMYTCYCQPFVKMNTETNKGKSCLVYKRNIFHEYYRKKSGNECFRCTVKTCKSRISVFIVDTSCGFIDFKFALLLKIYLRFRGSFLRFHNTALLTSTFHTALVSVTPVIHSDPEDISSRRHD